MHLIVLEITSAFPPDNLVIYTVFSVELKMLMAFYITSQVQKPADLT